MHVYIPIEVFLISVVLVKLLRIPYVINLAHILYLPILWASTRHIIISISLWDKRTCKAFHSSWWYCFVYDDDLWWLQSLLLRLWVFWLYLKVWNNLRISLCWNEASVSSLITLLASVLLLRIWIAVIFSFLGSKSEVLWKKIIIFCFKFSILLLSCLILTAVEYF